MSIATQITRLNNNIDNMKETKTQIKDAMNNDFDIIANEPIEDYAELIEDGLELYKDCIPSVETNQATEITVNDAMKYSKNKLQLFGNTEQATSILPEGYTQVDYIESNGTQYIDTGINADSNLRVLLDLQYKNTNENDSQIGAIYKTGTSTYKRHHVFQRSSSNTISVSISSSTYNTAAMDTNRHIIDMSTSKIVVDNNEYSVSVADFDTELNYWLLGRNSNDASLSKLSKSKLYKCKMWYNNILVRYFIPCKDSNNVVGLYDLVSQTFFGNDGTGDFVAGNEVTIPNPDYPQDIHVVTGNNTIGITGKNLFDKDNYNIKSLNAGGGGTFTSASNQKHIYIQCKPNTDYVVVKNVSNIPVLGIYEAENEPAVGVAYTSLYFSSSSDGKRHVTTSATAQYLDVRINTNAITQAEIDAIVETLIIAEGTDTNISYVPYYHADYPINLGNIELCKIGDYQDYFYKENGNWYKYNAINKIILDGTTETWGGVSTSNNFKRIDLINTGLLNEGSSRKTHLFCSISRASIVEDYNIAFNYNDRIFFYLPQEITTANEWKALLSQKTPKLYYILATPTSTQITDTTLISQLDAIYEHLQLTKGTNNITITPEDLAPYMKLSYKNYESNLTNE